MSTPNDLPTLGSDTSDAASTSAAASSTGSSANSASGSGSSPSRSSAAATQPTAGTVTAPNLSSDTTSTTAATAGPITNAPGLSTGGFGGLTGLPTLSGYYSYPPPTVPPTSNAPFMQQSSLPENFVFIIVGAVIAFVALVIIAWRVLTSWSINRRFRRYENTAGPKANYTPLADFKQKPSANASQFDMKDLSDKLPRNFSSVPSLFYSPTAEVANRQSSGGRLASGHMPAGHYRDVSDSRR